MKSRYATMLFGLLIAGVAHAGSADHIKTSHAWIRVLPGDLPAAAYVTLNNDSDAPIALTGASSTAYASIMLHKSSSEGGMNHMAMLDAMPVPAHGNAALAPAGYHLMLMKAVKQVQPGEHVQLLLKFADGSTLATDFLARPANAVDAGS